MGGPRTCVRPLLLPVDPPHLVSTSVQANVLLLELNIAKKLSTFAAIGKIFQYLLGLYVKVCACVRLHQSLCLAHPYRYYIYT